MFRRRLLGSAFACCLLAMSTALASAQSGRRVAVLLFDNREAWDFLIPDLRKELADLGWVEGKNLQIEWHFANGDAERLQDLAVQIANSGIHVVLTRGTPATRALRKATSTLPILTGVGDPIGSGFAKTYSNPDGNITGLSWASVETYQKQIELLKEMMPSVSRVIIVLKRDRLPFLQDLTGSLTRAARELGLMSETAPVGSLVEAEAALLQARSQGANAAFILGGITPREIAAIALRQRLPTVCEYSTYVEAGCLMSYRLDWENQTRRTAVQLDKVLRGMKLAQIPFELPTVSEFVINRSTANALGLTVPTALLIRANKIVD